MATASIQSVTTAVAGETNTPVEAVSNKSKRRKTSHLKIVPETRELRESIRQKCYDIAGKLNKDVPLSKDQMETVARRLLQEMGHPEGYLGWTMVIMAGAFFKDQIASIPPSRRLFPAAALFEACRGLSSRLRRIRHELQKVRCVLDCRLSNQSGRNGLQGTCRRGFADRAQDHCERLRRCDHGCCLLKRS